MKIFLSASGLLLFLIFIGCSKKDTLLQPEIISSNLIVALDRSDCVDCLCKAPNGATLPCSELSNWEEYTSDYVPGPYPDDPDTPEAANWKYITQDCPPTPTGKPQIKCVKKKKGDCREAFSCTECANCDI